MDISSKASGIINLMSQTLQCFWRTLIRVVRVGYWEIGTEYPLLQLYLTISIVIIIIILILVLFAVTIHWLGIDIMILEPLE